MTGRSVAWRRAFARGLGLVRDAWLIVGLALAGLVVLDAAYRAERAGRQLARGPADFVLPASHPYAREPWYPAFAASWPKDDDGHRLFQATYDPYRGWWGTPWRSRYITVDSAGRRLTVQPPGAGPRRVLLFGGSTMWGATARDSFTIPSLVAGELARRSIHDVQVLNMAQSGSVMTQEAITLLLELRAGRIPTAVVFLDGSNDVLLAYRTGTTGEILPRAMLERRFESARRGFWNDLLGLGLHSALVRRLARLGAGDAPERRPPLLEPACRDVALSYGDLVRSIEGLGGEFGFATIFFWQPIFATTHKPLTAWEQSLHTWPGYRDLVRRCSADADSLMRTRQVSFYYPLDGLFDHDTASVYLDDVGHVTEAGNAAIAARIVEPLLRAIDGRANGSP
jgi:hypothetical protein